MNPPLAYEFASPLPGYPELPSITLGREVDRFEANAATRDEMAKQARWTLAMVWAVTFIISLAVLAGASHWGLSRAEKAHQEQARV